MGGEIAVQSRMSEGTTFRVELPRIVADEDEDEEADAAEDEATAPRP